MTLEQFFSSGEKKQIVGRVSRGKLYCSIKYKCTFYFNIKKNEKKKNTFRYPYISQFDLCVLNFDTFKVKVFQENETHHPRLPSEIRHFSGCLNSFPEPWKSHNRSGIDIRQRVIKCNWFSIEAITFVSLCSRFLAAGFVGNPESRATNSCLHADGSKDTKSSQV